jgi:hypothetical protein
LRVVGVPLRIVIIRLRIAAIPYIFDNAMKMVGHYHHFVATFIGVFIFQFGIPPFNHFAHIVQYHYPILYFAQQTRPILHAHRYKIQPSLRIVVSL